MKILIVDDSTFIQKQIRKIVLAKYPDSEIVLAGNTNAARETFADNEFDFITIDYNMPGENGGVLLGDAIMRYPHAKIALLTANKQAAIREKVEKTGASFIPKPDFRDDLIQFLEP